MCDLEWGDCDEQACVFDDNEEGSKFDLETNIEAIGENFSSNSLIEESSPSSNKGRNKRPPV